MKELAEDFADTFSSQRFSPSLPPPPTATQHQLDEPFTVDELKRALFKLRSKSSPGADGITNQALKNLPEQKIESLLSTINAIWTTSAIPNSWRDAIVVPLLKPGKPKSDPTSYRPVALTSCVAKLVERMIHRRITWHLDKTGFLPPCMTGFRKSLSATDSLLQLITEAEENLHNKKRTAAAFLDIAQAFDRVTLAAIMGALKVAQIQGRTALFIYNFLADRRMTVRLGSTRSTPRLQNVGLPQGSVLSPLLFNLTMAKLPESLPITHPPLHLSIYADDVCLWTASKKAADLHRAMQAGLAATNTYVKALGLKVSASKTAYMLIGPGTNWGEQKRLVVNGHPIRRVRTHRFLGMEVDSRLSSAPYVKSARNSVRSSLNLTKRLGSYSSGCPQRTALKLHAALTVQRLMYAYPYANMSASARQKLEQLHRRGLRNALGIPSAASTDATYTEAEALPLPLIATQRLLTQITRLESTAPGRNLLRNLNGHQHSRFAVSLRTFGQLGLQVASSTDSIEPWNQIAPKVNLNTLRGKKKKDVPDVVARALAAETLQDDQTTLHIFTDASVNTETNTCGIAFHIPKFQASWGEAIKGKCASTDGELLAIYSALQTVKLTSPPQRNITVGTDSKPSIQIIANHPEDNPIASHIREIIRDLHQRGQTVTLQWLPAHMGITANETADKLAKAASKKHPIVDRIPSKKSIKADIKKHVWSFHPSRTTTQGKPPAITSTLSRKEASLLSRLRTGSAKTRSFLNTRGATTDPHCPTCKEKETISHLLLVCRRTSKERTALLAKLGLTNPEVNALIFPDGNAATRRKKQRILLQFLKDTGLDGRL